MSLSSRCTASSSAQLPLAKRKHFDEETQFYADEDESWKKQRTVHNNNINNNEHDDNDYSTTQTSSRSSSSRANTTNNSNVTIHPHPHQEGDWLQAAKGYYSFGYDPSTNVPVGSLGECYGDNSGMDSNSMDVDEVDGNNVTTHTDSSSSWSMINSKELRRQTPEKTLVAARRDIMKLWRVSSTHCSSSSSSK